MKGSINQWMSVNALSGDIVYSLAALGQTP